MAQPVSNQPVPKQVTPTPATPTPTPTPTGPEIKVESSAPRENIPSAAPSSEVKPQPAQTSDPQWRSDGNRSEDKSDMSISDDATASMSRSEEVASNWLQDTASNAGQEGKPVKPSPANYSAEIQQKASTQDKFQVIAWHGMERLLVDDLVKCTHWQEVKITVVEQGVLPDLLSALQKALSDSGQQKKVYLEFKMDEPIEAFKWPSSPALQLAGLRMDFLMDCEALAKVLELENASLTEVIWSSADEPDPQVQSLLKGSHQLQTLELSPMPKKLSALLDMLKLKQKLEALHMGKGKWKGNLLPQIVSHGKLNRLTLEMPKFVDNSFQKCSAAFANSALIEFNVYAPRLDNKLENKSVPELLDGVSKAGNLSTLGLRDYGKSALDEALLKAFAKNPAARTVNVLGKYYPASLDTLLIKINQDRVSMKWEPISLKCPDGAVARS